jgi:hypothetical protein
LDRRAFEERPNGVDAGPLAGVFDQTFLGAMTENVLEALPLRSLLPADHDCPVAPRPELLLPIGEPE